MNDRLNFRRLGKLIAFDARRCAKKFLVNYLILIALPILLWVLSLIFGFSVFPLIRCAVFFGAMMLAVVLFPSRAYGEVNLPRDGVAFAMLPASSFEKFASMVFYMVLVPILVLLGSYLVDVLLTVLPWGGFNEFVPFAPFRFLLDFVLEENGSYDASDAVMIGGWLRLVKLLLVAEILAVCAYFLFCNTLFKRNKLGYGILMLIGIRQVLSFFFAAIAPEVWSRYSGTIELDNLQNVAFPDFIGRVLIVSVCIRIVFTMVCVVASYYRLRNAKY